MGNRDKQRKQAKRHAKHQERERLREVRQRQLGNLAQELGIPYEQRYHALKEEAVATHRDLVGVFDCDDENFYSKDRLAPLKEAGLDGWQRILLTPTDDLDFSADPSISAAGVVNDCRPRPEADTATGFTSIIERDGSRKFVVFMRKRVAAAGDGTSEADYAFKYAALLHELGHVTDFEARINYDAATDRLNVVKAEVFAHRFACDELLRRNCRHLLKHWLQGLEREARHNPSD